MYWQQPIQYAALTDVGFRRQNNQDSLAVKLAGDVETWQERGNLFVVADGMGGHAVGELASKLAVDTIPHAFDKRRDLPVHEALRAAVESANEVIHDRGLRNPEFLRMGTTCSALVLGPHGASISHVGDSRIYRIRDKRIDQLTADHSLVWELIQRRKVHPRDADRLFPRNVITRSLGPEPTVQVDLEGPSPVFPGDVFVLCSDGLSNQLSDPEIGMIAGELPPGEACRLMVHLANLRGGPDNITAVVVKVGPIPDGASLDQPSVAMRAVSGGWGPFVISATLAIALLSGLYAAAVRGQIVQGSTIMVLSALLWIATLFVTIRRRSDGPVRASSFDPLSTVVWRPYRTAPAKLQIRFLEEMARLEGELQRAAREEGWRIDWERLEDHLRKAMSAAEKRRLSLALAEYARSFDLLMTGLLEQRRRAQHEAKWGKQPPPRSTGPSGMSPSSTDPAQPRGADSPDPVSE
jgi:protein phosphatase